MKNLETLKPASGSNHSPKRLGRGIGSGLGKTAGKGHKGQKARSGGRVRPGFEGGQTPLYRRIPKYGFVSVNKIEYALVSLEALNVFEDGSRVDAEALIKQGLIKSNKLPVKILNNGALKKKLTIKVEKITKSAKEAVAKLGGTTEEK